MEKMEWKRQKYLKHVRDLGFECIGNSANLQLSLYALFLEMSATNEHRCLVMIYLCSLNYKLDSEVIQKEQDYRLMY